ncbi:MAG: polyphosphate kinase 1 [Methanocorpusculum sp.]|nr:polyphosphate kinase 1 [Methanocorpusculum sp.]
MLPEIIVPEYTQNRELSWLKFNERVLAEAADEAVPLMERLKFVAIFTSNLDEFFMIRVGSLYDLKHVNDSVDNRSGMTYSQQLDAVFAAVKPLYAKAEEVYLNIETKLRRHKISNLSTAELNASQKKFIEVYYKREIEPIISPQIVDSHHPFPHLRSKVIYAGALLKDSGRSFFGVVPVPQTLPEIVYLPGSTLKFVRTEEILLDHLESIFNMYDTAEKTLLCVTRNADINPNDEAFDINSDFRIKMQKLLSKRKRLDPVRLELSNDISDRSKNHFCHALKITEEQIYISKVPMKLGYVYSLYDKLSPAQKKVLEYKEFSPCRSPSVISGVSMFRQVSKHDILLSYPFESMKPFLDLVKEAAYDKDVISIKITIYRLAKRTKLVDYLCTAAENGKDVTVMIELRARFDEQNNIDWSERLEDAGCKIIYGFEDYKVHSKICLITRKEKTEVKYYVQVGTGNYNEKTAELYTDLSLMTANQIIGREANDFFKNMAVGNLEGSYTNLLVSPVSLKSTVLKLIDEEIAKGSEGRIRIKINSITDVDIMEKFKEASCSGVKIELMVRGICCILPDMPGRTENITVKSIVGRFLEHSRIYCFGKADEEIMYISSADFMTRNTERRVEVACRIFDSEVQKRIRHILDVVWSDNVKGRILQSDGNYTRIDSSKEPVNSQLVFLNEALVAEPQAIEVTRKIVKPLKQESK